jgi:hypothetical protein
MTGAAGRPSDAAVLAVVAREPGAVVDAERRVAQHFAIEVGDAHAQLSRLFAAGHVRFVRCDGVMTYEVRTSPTP